ncbi:MAG: acyloxyacyl hydrolase [Hyphomonadaceae bacterium]
MIKALWMAATALATAAFAGPAHAGVDELRLGAQAHNFNDDENKEQDGFNVNAEIVFDSPGILQIIGSPRPYAMASVNTEGDTSWAGVGLYWRWEFADGWALEPGLGYVIHDGEIDVPDAEPGRILFGSRDLFRDTLALERELGDHFAMQLYFEHLSHGQIIGSGRNQGTEELGVRGIWRFRPQ